MAINGGPPPGSVLAHPKAQRFEVENMLGGPQQITTSDPAFQPPADPLDGSPTARAGLVYRELPLVTIQNSWTVEGTRAALCAHNTGIFYDSGQLCDSIIGDDRVQATMNSRVGGLFGCRVVHRPADSSDEAKACYDAWVGSWSRIAPEPALRELTFRSTMMGFSIAQSVWDTTGDLWVPQIRPWHPSYSYYHWNLRKYVAITLDGQLPVIPGDGKWLLHSPYGDYRGWMYGAIRALTEPWLIRHFAIRDWARFSEIHGLPTRVGMVPAASDPAERAAFENSIGNLGSSTAMILPTGVDGINGYDYKLIEATDAAWQSFPGLRDHCDSAITLAILGQNLTTEVKEGSFAAARVHGDVRQGILQADNRALSQTIHEQLARPFALYNFGNADLAPWTEWEVTPWEDFDMKAKMFQAFGTALEVMRRGGVQFQSEEDISKMAKSFGLDLPEVKLVDPISGGLGSK